MLTPQRALFWPKITCVGQMNGFVIFSAMMYKYRTEHNFKLEGPMIGFFQLETERRVCYGVERIPF